MNPSGRPALAFVAGFAALWGGSARGQSAAKQAEAPRAASASRLAADVLRRVKQATVHIKVTLPNNQQAQGSGFFGVGPGVVLTNAHVLGMFKADSRRPVKVEVIAHSGDADEATMPAQVLGVDTDSDLALLKVTGPKPPNPLEVRPADDLIETQEVYVFGFPLGSLLGKAITVNVSSVSSLRRDKAGVLQRVQLHGGMNPGNSGGPVVDTEGKVIGVSVSVIGQTQINFAIPGEIVQTFMAGKVREITMGHPYKDGAAVKSLMDLKLIDPLNKIPKVSLLVWGGPSAKSRAEAPPPPPPGDPKRRDANDLPVKDAKASTVVSLPAVAAGEVYWVQPHYTDGAGRVQKWLPVIWPVKPPVDRGAVVLKLNHKPNTKNALEMISNSAFTLRDSDGEEHTLTSNMKVDIIETVGAVDSQGVAGVHLRYRRITLGTKLDNQPIPQDRQSQAMIPNLFKVGADLRVDSQGAIIDNKLDMSSVPRNSRPLVASLASRIQKSVEAVELSLPGKLTQANVAWTGRRDLPIETVGDDELGIVDARYMYIGHRDRAGVDEALVEIKGDVKGSKGNGLNLGGRVQGLATVDLGTGQVVQANVTTYLDFDIALGNRPGKANGRLEVRLGRKPAPAGADPTKPGPAPKADPAPKAVPTGLGR